MLNKKTLSAFFLLAGTSCILSLSGSTLAQAPIVPSETLSPNSQTVKLDSKLMNVPAISLSSNTATSTPLQLNLTASSSKPQAWLMSQVIPGTNTRQCNPPKWRQYRTILYYCSQPGDYIGGGKERIFTPVDGDFIPSGSSSGGVVSIYFNGGPDWWHADFIAPRGAKLEKGTYKGAQRYPFQSPTKPGFSFSGSGRGCNRLSAQFTVYQIVYDKDGKIKLFDASFTQNCEETMPPLYGRIRYNRADAPPQSVKP